ncbi:hypothetical protein NXC12_CH01773 [Rhizobium etli]|uniref:DUF2809 domain-containing protein n=1 Tax=Rhizobium etli TaxID=29449 RepID=A0AAN1BF21_RHIET|nr:hypothetical protein NXC12_CH01773 [Rhizobium etli]
MEGAMREAHSRAQFLRLAAVLVVIAAGLALRRFGYTVNLPFVVVKYGGSTLWGAMVYLLAALVLGKSPRSVIAVMALFMAVAVELFRFYHTPWLDAFRLTTAGALLLGRIFSVRNILAYAIGIAAACAFDSARR